MDDERRSLIVTAAVGLLVLAIIIGSVYYLVRFIQNRQRGNETTVSSTQQTSSPQATASSTPSSSTTPGSTLNQQSGQANFEAKIFNVGNSQFSYPKNWGLLTCSNSVNFELDPTNSQDSKIACDIALKPVTVLVTDNLNCQGESAKLGNNQVMRSSEGSKGGGEVSYRWCVVNPNGADLDITHRVSQSGSRATSKTDYAQQIEQMISQIRF